MVLQVKSFLVKKMLYSSMFLVQSLLLFKCDFFLIGIGRFLSIISPFPLHIILSIRGLVYSVR